MITGELKNKIDGIWDIFWSSGMTNPLTVIEQITYLLFIKILDDNEQRKESNAAAFDMPVVDPIFDQNHQNCRWSVFRQYDPETMFSNMTEKVFPFIKTELTAGKDTAFARYMKDALFLVPTPRVLAKVVDALTSLDLNNKDIYGGSGENFTLGLNYYVNNSVKIVLNYQYSNNDRYANGKGKLLVGHDADGKPTADYKKMVDPKGKGGISYHMLGLRLEVNF